MAGLLRGLAADAVWRTGTDRFGGLAALEDLFEAWLCTLDPSLETYTSFADGNRVAAQMLEQLTIDGKVRQMNIAVFLKVKGSLGVLPVGVMSICRRPLCRGNNGMPRARLREQAGSHTATRVDGR